MDLPQTQEKAADATTRRAGRTQGWDTPVYDEVVAELGVPGQQTAQR